MFGIGDIALIIQLDEAKRTLLAKSEDISELASALKLDELKEEIAGLEQKTLAENFWNSSEESGENIYLSHSFCLS